MGFFIIRRRLCRWQANRPLDPVEYEANHLFVTGEVFIALSKFGTRDGFLPVHMPGHLRLGEDRVDAMNGSAPDTRDVTSILCFCQCIAEVIDIDLQELERRISAGSKRLVLDIHLCLEWVWRKINVGIHQVLGDVSCRFCNGAEQGWALYPTYLHCLRHHDLHWPPSLCGRTYAKLKLSSGLTVRRQKPSLMSNLQNKIWSPTGGGPVQSCSPDPKVLGGQWSHSRSLE